MKTTTKLLSLLLALCMVLSLAPVSALAENDAIEEAPAAEAVEESVPAPEPVSEPEPEPAPAAPEAPAAEEEPVERVEPSVPAEAAKAVPSQGSRGEISALTSDAGETGEAYYTLTASPAPIAGSGESSFVCTVQELQFGKVHVAQFGDLQAESILLHFFAADPADPDNWDSPGSLSDGAGHTLQFSVGGDHGPQDQVLFTPQTPVPIGFNMVVYIDPSEWASAQPGTYTGYMYYLGEWICEDGYQVSGEAKKISLTVVVPDASAPHSVQIASMANGSVTAVPASAVEGETVTLTVTPEEDYALDWLAVYKYAGGSVSTQTVPTEGGDGVYTFTMPATDVIVKAEFIDKYPLTVGGVEVTAANASDILGDGKVSYDAETATLTLDDADIPAVDLYEVSSVVMTQEQLDLKICGTGTIRGGVYAHNCDVTLNGNLTIESTASYVALNASDLIVSGGTVKLSAENAPSAVSIDGQLTMLNDEAIRRPQGGYFSKSGGMGVIMASQYSVAKEVVFSDRDFHLITPETYIMHAGGAANLTVDQQDAVEGETVTFTLVPAEGYMVDELVVQYKVPYEYHSGYEYKYITPDYDSAQGTWSFTMPGYDVTLRAYIIDQTKTWEYLQTKIDENWMVTLHHDVTGDPEDVPLSIPSGRNVTIDLNGYTLDRGLTNGTAQTNGNAITNEGTLTIIDSSGDDSGRITGANNDGSGGAITNNGDLTIEAGTFIGNKAKEGGAVANTSAGTLMVKGGVFRENTTLAWGGAGILNQGVMTMTGGEITDNHITATGMNGAGIWTNNSLTMTGGAVTGNTTRTGNGGGIYFTGGTLSLSGSPVIFGNTGLGEANDVCLNGDYKLTISDELTDASVGVTFSAGDAPAPGNPRTFTTGLSGKGTAEHFFSDKDSCYIGLLDGEACFSVPGTITIVSTERGTITADKTTAKAGETVTLTAEPAENCKLSSLAVYSGETAVAVTDNGDGTYTFTMPDQNVTVEAEFKDKNAITSWAELQAAISAGGEITLTQDVTASSTDSALVVPTGKTVTLDLNGHAVDRNLTSSTSDGYVIKNNGTLTICDTSAAQSGVITGGYNTSAYSKGGGIYNNGTLTLNSGTISGNHAYDCPGVYNDFSSGVSFTMNGGAIRDNISDMGGAGVGNYGVFTMNGGTISGNSAVTRGGGVWSMGTFTMNGGTITDNTAGDNGGGVCVRWGYATISGGTITGNTAAGTSEPEEPSDWDTTVGGCGGGLYIDKYCEVTISGGTIIGNTAANKGGDVYLHLDGSSEPVLKMYGSPVANVYLAEGKVITVTGAFTEGANVAVSTEAGTGVFTSGYGTYNGEAHPTQYFRAADSSNGILLSDGEAALGAGVVVNNVSYVERSWNGTEVVSETKTRDAIEVPSNGSMTSGWYYLDTNVKKNGRIESITGDVNLILKDGCTLDVKGLYVPAGSTLTIYAQSDGENAGKLYSHPSGGGAAIGGYSGHDNGNIVIHGGVIEANGDDHCAGIGSNDGRTGGSITIYGGTITAKGGSDGAAIGGGRDCDGGTITIYGGNITANGPTDSDTCENGAGIGGGDCGAGGSITIWGGTITTYSRDGAGIGGGDDGAVGTITINGGTITANKVNEAWGARIGCGADGAGGTITINGGTVTVTGGKGAGIGGGYRNKSGIAVNINGGVISAIGDYGIGNGGDAKASVSVTLDYTDATKDSISITSTSYNGAVTLAKDFSKYSGDTFVEKLDSGTVGNNNSLSGVTLRAYLGESNDPVSYTEYSWNESTGSLESTVKTAYDYTVLSSAIIANYPDGLESGTYVVTADTTIEEYLYIRKNRTVNLIVLDGVTLTCQKGIGCGYDDDEEYAALNIFGAGTIVTTGQKLAAGIGGKDNEASGNITIHGCTITATGGEGGAGIGGGDGGQDPDGTTSIKIYAGTITATGGKYGAGIGGGDEQPGAHTYIYGGTITATSKDKGAGIGGGDEEGTLGVFIYGGTVTATGGDHGAGIGCGEEGGNLRKFEDGGGVNIMGGTVTATGGYSAAGIGGGYFEDMSGTVRITGSPEQVTITGGFFSAGIGGGCGDDNSVVTYKGDMKGTVTIDCDNNSGLIKIEGGFAGAGIGGGLYGSLTGKVYIKGGNVEVQAGLLGAGIGGGDESSTGAGGEGGDVYIGGGTLKVICTSKNSDDSDAEAIGRGNEEWSIGTDSSGSVYIASGNNKTGKYMRVCYSTDKGETWSTAKAGDRSSKCHKSQCILLITECNHCDYNGGSGLSYTANSDEHTAKCKYCNISFTEEHTPDASGKCTVCGYNTGNGYVSFDSNGGSDVPGQSIPAGGTAARPEDPIYEGEGFSFDGWYLVTDEATGAVASEPFDFDTAINGSIILKALWTHEHENGMTFREWDSNNSLPSSGSYYLTQDVTLPGSWECGSTVDLCLNGHTVKVNDISSLFVSGTLNLYDEEGGVITQKTDGVEDIVYITTSGTFNMYGGTITGSSNFMNAVMVYGSFNMYGGAITGNHKGVTVGSGAAFTVSGLVNITGNERYDVYLQSGVIGVSGPLDANSRIGVSADKGVITSGLNANGDTPNGAAENFFSDAERYEVIINADGEAELVEPVTATIAFDPGDENAEDEMKPRTVPVGSVYTLPECKFTLEGMVFAGWLVNGEILQPGDEITVTADTTVTALWEAAPTFEKHSLVLSGQIGVNFFLDLSSLTDAEKAESYMEFTVSGKDGTTTIDRYDAGDMNQTGEYYGFTCYVNSIQMADTITAVYHYGEGLTVTQEYSVAQYLSFFDDHASEFDAKTLELIHAIADYGHYAQPFLAASNGWTIGADHAEMTKHYAESYDLDTIQGAVAEYAFIKAIEGSGVTKATYKLKLDSETTVDVYLAVQEGVEVTASASFNGKTYPAVKQSDGRYLVRVSGISAHQLGDTITITGTAGSEFSVTVSALSYVRSVLKNDSFDEDAKNAMASLYQYYAAVKAYR